MKKLHICVKQEAGLKYYVIMTSWNDVSINNRLKSMVSGHITSLVQT